MKKLLVCLFVFFMATNYALADTLYAGPNYNTITADIGSYSNVSLGGGSVTVSSLNGVNLQGLYCLDLENNIGVPGTYSTINTNNGIVWENSYNSGEFGNLSLQATVLSGSTGSGPVELKFTNAGEIAYILDHYAYTWNTQYQEDAIQSAVWSEIYGNQFTLVGPSGALGYYDEIMSNVGDDPTSGLDWLSPTNGTYQQALVGVPVDNPNAAPEPVPASFVVAFVFCFGLLAIFGSFKRTK